VPFVAEIRRCDALATEFDAIERDRNDTRVPLEMSSRRSDVFI
jgi:hypothetical protein